MNGELPMTDDASNFNAPPFPCLKHLDIAILSIELPFFIRRFSYGDGGCDGA
jgi:hypothetical protein